MRQRFLPSRRGDIFARKREEGTSPSVLLNRFFFR
jgi:hypothetical protein